MTPCEQHLDRLDAWLDDELNSADEAALEKHLAACTACRHVFQSQGALARRITDLAEISNRIAVKTAAPSEETPSRFRSWRTAAAILLAVGAGIAAFTSRSPRHTIQVIKGPSARPGGVTTARSPVAPVRPEPVEPTVEVGNNQMAVRMETRNPSIHIIWIYDRPGAPALEGGITDSRDDPREADESLNLYEKQETDQTR